MHPLAGVRTSGTLVTVYGTGLATMQQCAACKRAVPTRFLRAGQLGHLPPAVAGYVSVEVSMNGQDYSSTACTLVPTACRFVPRAVVADRGRWFVA